LAGAQPAHASPPGPRIGVDDPTLVEGDAGYADLVFTVTLTNPTGRTVTVDYRSDDATATAPSDYQPTSGQLVFNKREMAKQIRVPVFGDTVYEGDETVTLSLTNAGGAVIADATGTGTIIENDHETFPLSASRAGTGEGNVHSDPAGIDCGTDCSEDYPSATSVTLTATPASGSRFVGWSGDCIGSGVCTVTMDAARSVTATFDIAVARELTVALSGDSRPGASYGEAAPDYAQGRVTSTPAGIDCTWSLVQLQGPAQGGDCAETLDDGILVTLTAQPAAVSKYDGGMFYRDSSEQSVFTGWGGACTGAEPTCTVTMSEARDVSATFGFAKRYDLTVALSGAERPSVLYGLSAPEHAQGRVTSTPAGIDCTWRFSGFAVTGGQGGDCAETLDDGTVVTLTAQPGAVAVYGGGGSYLDSTEQSTFTGWGGACTGTQPTCTVTMTQARNVTATFGFGS
jgi:large repetitive protein